jgi:hypothetical protein
MEGVPHPGSLRGLSVKGTGRVKTAVGGDPVFAPGELVKLPTGFAAQKIGHRGADAEVREFLGINKPLDLFQHSGEGLGRHRDEGPGFKATGLWADVVTLANRDAGITKEGQRRRGDGTAELLYSDQAGVAGVVVCDMLAATGADTGLPVGLDADGGGGTSNGPGVMPLRVDDGTSVEGAPGPRRHVKPLERDVDHVKVAAGVCLGPRVQEVDVVPGNTLHRKVVRDTECFGNGRAGGENSPLSIKRSDIGDPELHGVEAGLARDATESDSLSGEGVVIIRSFQLLIGRPHAFSGRESGFGGFEGERRCTTGDVGMKGAVPGRHEVAHHP